ncbi:MAG: SMC-Scp complex subunit ScpB [Spirochaetes bacterium GWF1_51_8]|nr:MAG: SMC-Scp complex subunit ScpB [Spirochaetes bacterium GWF1_51_8]
MKGSLFINKTYSRNELKGLFESVLFVSGKPVNIDELTEIFELTKNEVKLLAEELNKDYSERSSGMNIIHVAGGFQLVTNPAFKDELNELFGKRNDNRLTRSVLETLAVVSYKQPITKEDVDKVRGVSSTRSINTLLGYKLINISGYTEGVVQSPLYSTTKRFLELFKLKDLGDLPVLDSLTFDDLELMNPEESGPPEEEEGNETDEMNLINP